MKLITSVTTHPPTLEDPPRVVLERALKEALAAMFVGHKDSTLNLSITTELPLTLVAIDEAASTLELVLASAHIITPAIEVLGVSTSQLPSSSS